jgi:hypothetical protein
MRLKNVEFNHKSRTMICINLIFLQFIIACNNMQLYSNQNDEGSNLDCLFFKLSARDKDGVFVPKL